MPLVRIRYPSFSVLQAQAHVPDLADTASRAIHIIQVNSLNGVNDDRARLHGDNLPQNVHQARRAVEVEMRAALQTHPLCPAAHLPITCCVTSLLIQPTAGLPGPG